MLKKYSSKDLLNMPIFKSLLILAVPIMLANLLQSAYQLTDLFWVGKLGSSQVAALSVCFPIIMLFFSLGIGLSIAGSTLISQYRGKADSELESNSLSSFSSSSSSKVDKVLGQTILVILVVSLFFSVIGYFLSDLIISLMNLDSAVSLLAISYLKIYFLGTVFVWGYACFQGILRGVGEVRIPFVIVLGTVLLNLIIDPLFIYGWKFIPALGMDGAAIATIITQGLAFLIGLLVLVGGKYSLHLKLKNMIPDWKIVKKLFVLGIPTSFSMSARFLSMSLMIYIVSVFGTLVTAAYGVGIQLYGFVVLPALGLSMASSTLVGLNLGAKRKKKAQEVGNKASIIGFILLFLLGLVIFIFAKSLVTIFVPGQLEVISKAVLFVRLLSLSFGFVAVGRVFTGVFQGAGNMKVPMIISIISLWLFQLPFAYFISKYFLGELGIWIAVPLANLLAAILFIVVFLRGKWKDIDLVHKS